MLWIAVLKAWDQKVLSAVWLFKQMNVAHFSINCKRHSCFTLCNANGVIGCFCIVGHSCMLTCLGVWVCRKQ